MKTKSKVGIWGRITLNNSMLFLSYVKSYTYRDISVSP